MSPVPVLEIVNNGHVDGLAVLFAVAALAVLAGGDRHATARDVLAGVLIGAAALVKLYPGVLLIGIAGLGGRRWASLARASASASVLAVVTYLPHVARVGVHVLGYLPGYLAEEHYTTGGRFLLVAALHLPPGLGGALGGIAVGAACLGVCWRRAPPALGTTVIVGAVLLASTPVQPWYAVLLLALGTVAVRPEWTGVALAGYPYFFAVILASRHAAIVGETAYGVAATTVIVVAALRGSRSWTSRRRVETPADGASIPRAA